jgi:AraC-like DNA-binding protein
MNSKAAFFFAILLIIYTAFAVLLFVISKVQHRKGLFYMYISFLLRGILSLGPALLMFHIDISWTAYLTGPIKVTLIPLTYLYIQKLSRENKIVAGNDLWHFIPFFVNTILTIIIVPGHAAEIVGQSNETLKSTIQMVWDDNFYHNILAIPCRIISYLQAILYSFLIYKLYRKYIYSIKNNDSFISHYNVVWIKWVVVIIILQGFFEGFALVGIYHLSFMYPLAFLFLVLYAFFFFIHAMQQKDLAGIMPHEPVINNTSVVNNSSINIENQSILDRFKKDKLYLIPDISLQEAANKLKISKTKLTQYIKDAGYDNFYIFINQYRVERSKMLLSKMPENYVIESVINQSGFKARSTFYRVFKEITGETPSGYIRRNKKPGNMRVIQKNEKQKNNL